MKKKKRNKKLVLLLLPLLLLAIIIPFVLTNRQIFYQQAAPAGMRAIPDPLYGVTIDDIANISGVVASLSHFTHKPTTRIVFDEGQPPSYYSEAVNQIQPISYILGMIADSTAIGQYTPTQYEQRTTDYLNAFGNQVDIWEVGNEINGEWLGSDVPTKMVNAYNVVKNAGKRTALTLYYNGLDDANNCYENKDNLMFAWAQANIPDTMKQGLDYVFISYYEEDCPGVSKDWTTVFTKLHQMFPNSRIGFGENGTTEPSAPQALKIQYMHEYYPVWVNVPCYVAGNFWWNFYEDGIPYTNNTLWTTLNNDMNALVPSSTGCGAEATGIPTLPITRTPTLMPATPTLNCLGSCPTLTLSPSPSPTTILPSPSILPQQPGNPTSLTQQLLQLLMQILQFFLTLLRGG